MQNNRVYITHYESATSLGITKEQILGALSKNNPVPIYPRAGEAYFKPYYKIPYNYDEYSKNTKSTAIAFKMLDGCDDFIAEHQNIPVFLSTSTGGIRETELQYKKLIEKRSDYSIFQNHFFNKTANDIRMRYPKGKIGDIITFSTACSSSGHAILQAYRMIKKGVIDYAILMGIDVISQTTMVGFDSLQLVSSSVSKPLTNARDGLTLGEGGGLLILQKEPVSAEDFEVAGVASGTDGYHITSPDPSGNNQRWCIKQAIASAGISLEDIEYVNAHGTGTPMNDKIELSVLEEVFQEKILVTSLKSYIGHTLGASTIDEIAICIEMLKEGFIYQPLNFTDRMNSIIPEKTVQKRIRYFLKNSFGFGGNNVSVVIKTNIK